jgi:PhzF family phenazine biosynthesis protein
MKTYFADSFTNEPFKGNPAAVCFPESELQDAIMQNIAAEIGFSETAFVRHIADHRYNIRFFTPKQEIPLCGHATLAASTIIFNTTQLERICFLNCEGVVLDIWKSNGQIAMQFPVYDTEAITVPMSLLLALGINSFEHSRYSPKNKIILIEIKGTAALAGLQPDFPALIQSYSGINGVLVTAQSENTVYDFHYRYFWPWAGTNEDPVTGGVQTFLTKYWAMRLRKNLLRAFQSSNRTGSMTTELQEGRVIIYGEAITILEGQFKL